MLQWQMFLRDNSIDDISSLIWNKARESRLVGKNRSQDVLSLRDTNKNKELNILIN